MKNIAQKLKLVCVFSLLISATNCDKDFLDEPKPTSNVNSSTVFESKGGVEAFISGILRRFRAQYTRTDTGGVYSMYFARTIKGNDLIQRPSWYRYDYDNNNREPTYRRTTFTWNFCFYQINQTNVLIQGVSNSTSLSDVEKNQLLAQGRALRAFFYFQLSMEFQHTYSYDSSLPAVPIYTEPTGEGKPMNTLKEVYDFILEDLNFAVSNGTEDRLGKSYVNLNVINGILARVHLVMGNWSEALKSARAAQEGYSLDSSLYSDGFDDISNPEWIWGMPQTDDQTSYYYTAPHAFTDHSTNSYRATYVNEDFVSVFSDSDVRKLFIDPNGLKDYRRYVTSKFSFKFESDISIMRVSEMMLIEAECLARSGNDAQAQEVLTKLQSNRDAQATANGNTGDELIEEILLERRKELYGEIGVEWFDAKRLQRGITRTGNHRIMKNLEPNDKRFFLKIPQAEIDANENIDQSINENR